jgi:hypothetical protein
LERCPTRWSGIAKGCIYAGGRPTDAFADFCGQLAVGWVILEARDPQAKSALERSHHFMRTNFEPGRSLATRADHRDENQASDRDWVHNAPALVGRASGTCATSAPRAPRLWVN